MDDDVGNVKDSVRILEDDVNAIKGLVTNLVGGAASKKCFYFKTYLIFQSMYFLS